MLKNFSGGKGSRKARALGNDGTAAPRDSASFERAYMNEDYKKR